MKRVQTGKGQSASFQLRPASSGPTTNPYFEAGGEKLKKKQSLATSRIESCILTFRGQRVILDRDLARIYGVETRRLNEQVKRNKERFPEDFTFQLTREEAEIWMRSRSQFATLKRGQNVKYLPYAFTEHGAIMAANVLNSRLAIQMSVFVVRAFIKVREMAIVHRELSRRIDELERRLNDRHEDFGDIDPGNSF